MNKAEEGKILEILDYHDVVSIDTPKSTRRELNIGDIWENKVMCKKCGDVLVSTNAHHFISCGCGKVAIQGGSWLAKRFCNREDYEELSTLFTDTAHQVEEKRKRDLGY